MADLNYKTSDLGDLEPEFLNILKKYKLEAKKDQVWEILSQALLGKIRDSDLPVVYEKSLPLDFGQAINLGYDLKTEILAKKDQIQFVQKEKDKIILKNYNLISLADGILDYLDTEIILPDQKRKFYDLIVNWLGGNLNFEQLQEQITRSEKIGGLGMPESMTADLKAILTVAKEQLDQKKINIAKLIADYDANKDQVLTASSQAAEVLPAEEVPAEILLKYSPDNIANEFLTKLNYQITNENAKKRFTQAILSWLKDVRDISELKEVLTKPEKTGGIAMPEAIFNQLATLLIAKKEEISRAKIDMAQIIASYEAGQKESTIMPTEISEQEIDVAARAQKIEVQPGKITGQESTINQLLQEKGISYEELERKEAIKKQLEKIEQAAKGPLVSEIEGKEEFLESREELPAPAVESVSNPAPMQIETPAEPIIAPLPQPIQQPAQPQVRPEIKQTVIRKQSADSRPMAGMDVKAPNQAYGPVGPIEELAVFKLEDFRRLAKNPQEAAKKIIAKLDLLGEESLNRKADGIKALKNSPLYKVYSEIMNQAIKEGKSIEQVTAESSNLTMAEFKAIMDINKNLKY